MLTKAIIYLCQQVDYQWGSMKISGWVVSRNLSKMALPLAHSWYRLPDTSP